MYKLNLLAIFFACFTWCSLCASEPLLKTDDEQKPMQNVKSNDNEQNILELQRRKEIAENYMNTLAKAKETWVDPYEMISYPVKERQEKFSEPSDESTVKSSYNLNSDEEPLFSDIKGDVIGGKTSKLTETLRDSVVESGGSFLKDRQQICVLDSIYISRWLKKLILKVEKESNLEPSSVSFNLDANMLDNLKELSIAKSLEIAQVDELICGMLAQATVSRKEDYDWTIAFDYTIDLMWAVACIITVLLLAYILHQCIVHHPFLTMLCCFVILSVFWHWMHLYKQKQAFKHAELSSMKVPDQCRKYEFGLIEHIQEYIKSYFSNNECARYYEALMVDPFWEVSFSVAASEAASAMLFQPLSTGSRIVNSSLKQLFDGLGLHIIVPFMMFMFLLLIIMCNYRIKLPFFMGAIEPHIPSVGSRIEDVQSPKALVTSSKEKMCKIVHCIQDKDCKFLKLRQDIDRNLSNVFQDKIKNIPHCSRPICVNCKPNKSSGNCRHFGSSDVCCKNDQSFEDAESGNDSEEVGSSNEKPSIIKLTAEYEHCDSHYLTNEDIQYLHKDCRVCKHSEENCNTVRNVDEVTENCGEGFNCTSENCSHINSYIDQNCVDHCAAKNEMAASDRTSETVMHSGLCTAAIKNADETGDL